MSPKKRRGFKLNKGEISGIFLNEIATKNKYPKMTGLESGKIQMQAAKGKRILDKRLIGKPEAR